jgi:4-hydroxy-3-polyprenylbenzoate decarboxylase
MFENLTEFLGQLADDGELVRITAEVDPALEIAAVTNAVCKSSGGGPALFFENVKGHAIPVVTNLLGSRRRMCKALRCDDFQQLAARVTELLRPELPEHWTETLKRVPEFTQRATLPPRTVKTGLCQQVVKLGSDVDMAEFPAIQCWPQEPGRTLTAGLVVTRTPETNRRNVNRMSIVVHDRTRLVLNWTRQDVVRQDYEEYRRRNQPLPIAIVLGGDPIHTFTAAAPLPAGAEIGLFAGYLRGKHIELVRCRSNDLLVPADAEVVIEGRLEPDAEWIASGSIAVPTGFYGPEAELPVMEITAVTHRANPVFPAFVPAPPPTEDFWIGQASERMLVPLIQQFVPELVDLHQPPAGMHRNLLFASIRKSYPQQARKVMHALWSYGALAVSKMIVVVDGDVDVHDEQQVWFAAGSHVHPGRDVLFCEGPTHAFDHATPVAGMGHKLGIDATRKLPEEGHPRPWPEQLRFPDEVTHRIAERWQHYGLDIAYPFPDFRDRSPS